MKNSLTELSLVCLCLIIIVLIFSDQSLAQIDPSTCLGAWLFDDDEAEVEEDVTGNGSNGTYWDLQIGQMVYLGRHWPAME